MITVVCDKPTLDLKQFTELWLAVHDPELQARTHCVIGQQEIIVPITIKMDCHTIHWFDQRTHGNLVNRGIFSQGILSVRPGDEIHMYVNWETW